MVRLYSYGRRQKARKKSPLKPGVLPEGKLTFTGADLAALTDCEPKTLSAWRRQRILPRVPRRGFDTRYDRDHARRALAIAKAGVQAARLPRFAEMIPLILDEAPAPVDARTSPVPAAGSAPPASQLAAHLSQLAPSAEPDGPLVGLAWQTIELLPGLELRLAESAPPIMRAIVREVAKRFGRVV